MSAVLTAVNASIRPLNTSDRDAVIRIDARHTGRRNSRYWKEKFRDFVEAPEDPRRVALAAHGASGLLGFLMGEVRAFEFGSEPCGWIFAVGVTPDAMRAGVASKLLEQASRHFRKAGVRTVRTMVRRDNVPLLSFFRSNRFVGGPFVQLELNLRSKRP